MDWWPIRLLFYVTPVRLVWWPHRDTTVAPRQERGWPMWIELSQAMGSSQTQS